MQTMLLMSTFHAMPLSALKHGRLGNFDIDMVIKNHMMIIIVGLVPDLILKKRPKVIQKWPIDIMVD